MYQRTDDWFKARLGCVTASRISSVLSKGVSRDKYIEQLVLERSTGRRQEKQFTNAAIEHGINTEPLARRAYEKEKRLTVTEIAFVLHPRIKYAGASPDGFVGIKGLLEIKCPNTRTHNHTLEKDVVRSEYIKQMQWQMACTGREWCDFVSYDDRDDAIQKLYIKRIKRDESLIRYLEEAVALLLAEVDNRTERLMASKPMIKAATGHQNTEQTPSLRHQAENEGGSYKNWILIWLALVIVAGFLKIVMR